MTPSHSVLGGNDWESLYPRRERLGVILTRRGSFNPITPVFTVPVLSGPFSIGVAMICYFHLPN